MGLFKEKIYNEAYENNVRKAEEAKMNSKLGWNVYCLPETTTREYIETFGNIHGRLKYKIMTPVINFIARKFKNQLQFNTLDTTSHKLYARNGYVFDRAFKTALEEWHCLYQNAGKRPEGLTDEVLIQRLWADPNNCGYLKNIKAMYTTLINNDSAYKHFHDFLMHNITKEMLKEYDGEIIANLLYTSKAINDPLYFVIFQDMHDMANGIRQIDIKLMNKSHPKGVKFLSLQKAYADCKIAQANADRLWRQYKRDLEALKNGSCGDNNGVPGPASSPDVQQSRTRKSRSKAKVRSD